MGNILAVRTLSRLVVSCIAVSLAGAGSGCSQSVLVRADREDAHLYVDDEYMGPVSQRGTLAEVGPGFEPVPWELVDDDGEVLATGTFEREVSWIPLVLGLVGAAVCVPACAGAAVVLVNPIGWLAPLYLLGGTCAGFGTLAASPGWATLPCGFAGAACGLTPLSLLSFAQRVPPTLWVGTGPPPLDLEPLPPRPGLDEPADQPADQPADDAPDVLELHHEEMSF